MHSIVGGAIFRSEFDQAQRIIQQDRSKLGNYQLLMEHVNAWRDTFNTGRIEVAGDIQLAKTTWFAQYYILSSLPSAKPYLPPLYSEVGFYCFILISRMVLRCCAGPR